MSILNDSNAAYVGTQAVKQMYIGSQLVWPPIVTEAPTLPMIAVLPTESLYRATAVNQHLDYTDTTYNESNYSSEDLPIVQQILDLGIKTIRGGIPSDTQVNWKAPYMQPRYAALRDAGFKFHLVIPEHGVLADELAYAKQFFGDSVLLFEGWNEPYGFSSSDGAYAAQVAWWDLMRADSHWDAVPLISPSDKPEVYFDGSRPRATETQQGANIHPYAGGRTPEAALLSASNSTNWKEKLGEDVKFYVTEFGFHTAINNRNNGHFGVNGDSDQQFYLDSHGNALPYEARTDGLSTQAAYLLRGLLENHRNGIMLSSIYELHNQKPVDNTVLTATDPRIKAGYRDMEQHFGLLSVTDEAGVWRTHRLPSYFAVQRYQNRLAESGTAIAPAQWPYKITAPTNVHWNATARRSGDLDVALWNTESLQAETTYSPHNGMVRTESYTVVASSEKDGVGDAYNAAGHVYPAGSVARNGEQDVEWAKYYGATVGSHLYPQTVQATIEFGWNCRLEVMYPCRNDAITIIGMGKLFTVEVPAEPALYRAVRV